jgi:hypothetical protein
VGDDTLVERRRIPPSAKGEIMMRSRDIRATTAGVLLIVATVASLVATALLGSLLDGPDFLAGVSQHQDRVLTAGLFQLLAAFTSAAIAISFYPLLRTHAAAMALGSVAFRVIEGVFYAVSAAGTLVLVALSDQLRAGGALGAATQASGELARDLREAAAVVGVLAFYVGGTLYYLVFYRSRLIPRWLSVWGLAGTTLGAIGALLVLFRAIDTMSAPQVALNVPIGVQEIVLAVWLIWKGFNMTVPAPPVADWGPPLSQARA